MKVIIVILTCFGLAAVALADGTAPGCSDPRTTEKVGQFALDELKSGGKWDEASLAALDVQVKEIQTSAEGGAGFACTGRLNLSMSGMVLINQAVIYTSRQDEADGHIVRTAWAK